MALLAQGSRHGATYGMHLPAGGTRKVGQGGSLGPAKQGQELVQFGWRRPHCRAGIGCDVDRLRIVLIRGLLCLVLTSLLWLRLSNSPSTPRAWHPSHGCYDTRLGFGRASGALGAGDLVLGILVGHGCPPVRGRTTRPYRGEPGDSRASHEQRSVGRLSPDIACKIVRMLDRLPKHGILIEGAARRAGQRRSHWAEQPFHPGS